MSTDKPNQPHLEFKEITLKDLEADAGNPRLARDYDKSDARLFQSILKYGLQEPLLVSEFASGRYRIIDGHRRYYCLKKIAADKSDFDTTCIPCRVKRDLSKGDKEIIRFEVQTNRRPWKPYEKTRAIATVRKEKNLKDPKDVAALINISLTSVRIALDMQEQAAYFLQLIGKFNLTESYVHELVRLNPKLVRIKEIEAPRIAEILFDKAHRKIIRSAKEFRKLAKIFMRFKSNENEIYQFLCSPNMTIEELEVQTNRSSLILFAEKFLDELAHRSLKGAQVETKELEFFRELKTKLHELIPD